MNVLFYIAALVAILATLRAVTDAEAVHALLYLIVSLLALALIFFILGAAFVAALEVIVYAGAIIVLFVFALMTLNLSPDAVQEERQWLDPTVWRGPSILAAALIVELIYMLARTGGSPVAATITAPKQVGLALYGPYLLGVELASILLLTGLVGAYHLARPETAGDNA